MTVSSLASSSPSTLHFAKPAAAETETAVILRGDGEPQSSLQMITQLAEFASTTGIAADIFSRGGTVEQLEQRFASMLGKETAVFMPTGTLANHLAIRQLCKGRPRAIVQEQSHLYQDTGDCVAQLSGITLVPLAHQRPYFTLEELHRALQGAAVDRVARPVGAVMIETPVRRQHGQIMPYDTLVAITDLCRGQQIATHLDGARLYMMSAATGIHPAQYASHFDTVYVSLYKYFGAPFGAILAGPLALLHDLYHTRRMFGAGLASASLAAALALRGIDGFAERFAAAMVKGREFIAQLNQCDGIHIGQFPHGSNIFPVQFAPDIDTEQFLRALSREQIFLYTDTSEPQRVFLTINPTILRQTNEVMVAAFQRALDEARGSLLAEPPG